MFQLDQVNGRSRAPSEIRYLAIDAAPVACVVGVKIDANGYSSRAAGNNRVNIGQPGAVTVVVFLTQNIFDGRTSDYLATDGNAIIPEMLITRKFEFDAGHRISTHQSQCRNLHGHRYVLEVTISGGIITDAGAPEQGMVMDFSGIKRLIREALVEQWDHAFLVYVGDTRVLEFLQSMDDHKTVVLKVQPTAENLALIAFDCLHRIFQDRYAGRLELEHIRLFETPNCWADVSKADFRSASLE